MQTIAKVQDPELITQGLFPSLAPNQLALWRTGFNIRFNRGRASKSTGYTVEPTTVIAGQDYTINCMTQSYVDEARRIFFATNLGYNSLNLYDDGVYKNLGSGYADGNWSMITFGTWLLATNNADAPFIWKNTDGAAIPLGGVNFLRCKILRKNNNHIFALNLDTGGQRVQWSAISDPESWTPLLADDAGDPGNDAGGIDVRDLDSDISACETIGEDLAFYSANSMGRIIYTGDAFVYSVKVVLSGIGAVGANAVISVGADNYGLGRKGFWKTDGLSYDYIDRGSEGQYSFSSATENPSVQDWIADNIDWQQAYLTVGLHNQKANVVEWHFICKDATIRGLAFDYVTHAWTILQFPITFGLEQQVFDFPTVATGKGFGFYGSGNNMDTEPLPALLVSAAFDGGSPDNYKIWDCVRTDIKTQGLVQIKFGFSDTPKDEDFVWGDWQTIDRDNFIPQQYDAPYAAFQIQSTEVDCLWELGGVNILGELGAFI